MYIRIVSIYAVYLILSIDNINVYLLLDITLIRH